MNGDLAYEFGLAHRVVSGEPDIIDSSREILDRLLELSGPAYSNLKKDMLESIDATFDQSQSMSLSSRIP